MNRALALVPAVAVLAGCTSVQLSAAAGAQLDPVAFFTGRSQGRGTFNQIFSSSVPLEVRSEGRPDGRGGLSLTQRIVQGGKPPRIRTWIIRPAGPGLYTGSLTEAVGPVTIAVRGSRAEVCYRMKGGLAVRQQLALQPGGKTILNHLEVRKWGVQVARVDETIRKLD